jgi:hypothetical protein
MNKTTVNRRIIGNLTRDLAARSQVAALFTAPVGKSTGDFWNWYDEKNQHYKTWRAGVKKYASVDRLN